MRVYWKDMRRGQNLILSEQEGQEEVIGGYRETSRGIDAYAQTFGYDPGRSQKGFATVEDAREFVESFRPWELHGVQDVTVDREAGPDSNPGSITDPVPSTSTTDEPTDETTESVAPEHQPRKRWWEFWKRD